MTYLHLEKNRFTTFPKDAFRLVPSLLALHLENNTITRLEADTLKGAEGLRALYLTGNAISHVTPGALDAARDLDLLHLGGNKLKEVPTEALSKLGNLRDLRLSGNSVRWVGPNAFQLLQGSLKELYLDNMGLEKVSDVFQYCPLSLLLLLHHFGDYMINVFITKKIPNVVHRRASETTSEFSRFVFQKKFKV